MVGLSSSIFQNQQAFPPVASCNRRPFLQQLADPSEARGCSTKSLVINSFSQYSHPFPPTALWRRHAQTVRDSTSSLQNRLCQNDQKLSKSQRASKSLHWLKSYDNFTEGVDLAYWWSCIGKGLHLQPAKQAGFQNLQAFHPVVSCTSRPSLRQFLALVGHSSSSCQYQQACPPVVSSPRRPFFQQFLVLVGLPSCSLQYQQVVSNTEQASRTKYSTSISRLFPQLHWYPQVTVPFPLLVSITSRNFLHQFLVLVSLSSSSFQYYQALPPLVPSTSRPFFQQLLVLVGLSSSSVLNYQAFPSIGFSTSKPVIQQILHWQAFPPVVASISRTFLRQFPVLEGLLYSRFQYQQAFPPLVSRTSRPSLHQFLVLVGLSFNIFQYLQVLPQVGSSTTRPNFQQLLVIVSLSSSSFSTSRPFLQKLLVLVGLSFSSFLYQKIFPPVVSRTCKPFLQQAFPS